MIPLKEYIDIKQNPENYVCEGGIWKSIKKWIKGLFSNDNDKEYSWWEKDPEKQVKGDKLQSFEEYKKNKYNNKNLSWVKFTTQEAKKTIFPIGGTQPDEAYKEGFYKFLDVFNDEKTLRKNKFFANLYKDNSMDWPVAIICGYVNPTQRKEFILRQVQINPLWINKAKYETIVKEFGRWIKTSEEYHNIVYMKYYENFDKEIFNILINDCKFTETTDKNDYDKVLAFKKI